VTFSCDWLQRFYIDCRDFRFTNNLINDDCFDFCRQQTTLVLWLCSFTFERLLSVNYYNWRFHIVTKDRRTCTTCRVVEEVTEWRVRSGLSTFSSLVVCTGRPSHLSDFSSNTHRLQLFDHLCIKMLKDWS